MFKIFFLASGAQEAQPLEAPLPLGQLHERVPGDEMAVEKMLNRIRGEKSP
jgi:hypothetical protein